MHANSLRCLSGYRQAHLHVVSMPSELGLLRLAQIKPLETRQILVSLSLTLLLVNIG